MLVCCLQGGELYEEATPADIEYGQEKAKELRFQALKLIRRANTDVLQDCQVEPSHVSAIGSVRLIINPKNPDETLIVQLGCSCAHTTATHCSALAVKESTVDVEAGSGGEVNGCAWSRAPCHHPVARLHPSLHKYTCLTGKKKKKKKKLSD